jgi:ABC-type uncharacterized transport system involved in gliding motility auxiliary subunit
MNNKKLEALLYSSIGIAVMFLIIIAINVIVGATRTRIDLTEGKLHTISPGTRAILQKLDSPVEIRFYCSKSGSRMPSQFRTYAQDVEDLLEDFREISKGKIEIKKFDPKPDSDAEDLARLDGVEGQPLQTGETIYLGLAVSLEPAKVAIPFLHPERERLLEYDLARAVSQVMATNKPVVGVMSTLPIFGQPPNPMMMRMGQQGQGQDPWVFLGELRRDFDVREIKMDVDKIDEDIKVLLVIHPKDIKDAAQYALDQFVLRGGRLIAFVDALCIADRSNQNPQMMGLNPGSSSTLDKLFKAWGINFENTKVAADLNFARELGGHNNQPQIVPTFMFVDRSGMDNKDVLTGQIDEVLLPCPGTFSGTPVAGLKQQVLMHSTTNSQLVDGFMASMSPQKVMDEFKPSGTQYPVAIRLTGKFKTAFPDGKPEAPKTEDDKDKKEETPKDTTEQIKEGKAENSVTLVGDSDWVYDQFCARVQNFFGQKMVSPIFGNLTLCQAMVETMSGDQNLIAVRSRATLSRPFTVIRQKQSEANMRFQAEIKKLEDKKAEVERKLNELQQTRKDNNQRFILSKEQQDEIAKFRAEQGNVGKELKRVRKELTQDIESLENKLKWMNIAGMPVLVTAVGLVLAYFRKQRTKAV